MSAVDEHRTQLTIDSLKAQVERLTASYADRKSVV